MKMKKLGDLLKELRLYFNCISEGDDYKNEDGLQRSLYSYLKSQGYAVVYELELPNLKPTLRPDLVVNLGINGFVCIELKYNETNEAECEEDAAKCDIYVQQCSDVHYAISINLCKKEMDGFVCHPCNDQKYVYNTYEVCDTFVAQNGLFKSPDADSIKPYWDRRLTEIKSGNGKYEE